MLILSCISITFFISYGFDILYGYIKISAVWHISYGITVIEYICMRITVKKHLFMSQIYVDISRPKRNLDTRMQVDSLKHQISREIKDHRDGRDMYQYETRETLKPIVDSQTEGSEAADAKKTDSSNSFKKINWLWQRVKKILLKNTNYHRN